MSTSEAGKKQRSKHWKMDQAREIIGQWRSLSVVTKIEGVTIKKNEGSRKARALV